MKSRGTLRVKKERKNLLKTVFFLHGRFYSIRPQIVQWMQINKCTVCPVTRVRKKHKIVWTRSGTFTRKDTKKERKIRNVMEQEILRKRHLAV